MNITYAQMEFLHIYFIICQQVRSHYDGRKNPHSLWFPLGRFLSHFLCGTNKYSLATPMTLVGFYFSYLFQGREIHPSISKTTVGEGEWWGPIAISTCPVSEFSTPFVNLIGSGHASDLTHWATCLLLAQLSQSQLGGWWSGAASSRCFSRAGRLFSIRNQDVSAVSILSFHSLKRNTSKTTRPRLCTFLSVYYGLVFSLS